MNVHKLIQYGRYCIAARGRRGTHSPFVYDFIESVVRDRNHVSCGQANIPGVSKSVSQLIGRIMGHYGFLTVDFVASRSELLVPTTLLVFPDKPELWTDYLSGTAPGTKMIVVPGIHRSATHTGAWNLLHQSDVPLTIDLFHVGLLCFGPEFREKQHFVVKC